MTILDYYIIFCITTALAANLELFFPVINAIELYAQEVPAIKHKWITVCTLTLMAFIFAPLIFPACVIPSFSERFRKSLQLSLEKQ